MDYGSCAAPDILCQRSAAIVVGDTACLWKWCLKLKAPYPLQWAETLPGGTWQAQRVRAILAIFLISVNVFHTRTIGLFGVIFNFKAHHSPRPMTDSLAHDAGVTALAHHLPLPPWFWTVVTLT